MVCSNAYTEVAFSSMQIQQRADPFEDNTWYWVFGALILLTALLLAVGCYFRNKEQHEGHKSHSAQIHSRIKEIEETNKRDGHIKRRNTMKSSEKTMNEIGELLALHPDFAKQKDKLQRGKSVVIRGNELKDLQK